MGTVTLSKFLPLVLPFTYGCSDPLAEQAILSSCQEFGNRTLRFTNISYENSVAGRADYDVEVPPMTTLSRVLSVFYKSGRLKARATELVTNAVAIRGGDFLDVSIAAGTPREWFMRDASEPAISIYPPPAESLTGAVTIRAAFAPSRDATRVDDAFWDDYAEDIANGAIARLLAMPNQPFSAPAAAKQYRDDFNRAIDVAADIGRIGKAAAVSRVVARPFA